MPLIAKPVAQSASDRKREIGPGWVGKIRPIDRPAQKGNGQSAKYRDRQPIVNRGHYTCMVNRHRWCKAIASFAMIAILAACSSAPPTGQVVAIVDGIEITARELAEERRYQLVAGQLEDSDAALLDDIVRRKLLATEAERLDLEQDPLFHFAWRRSRETVLVEALYRDAKRQIDDPSPETVSNYQRTAHWRFADRTLLHLSSPSSPTVVQRILDTAELEEKPAPPLLRTPERGKVMIGGTVWLLAKRELLPFTGPVADEWASRVLKESAVQNRLEQLILQQEKTGQVQYQTGYGPSRR